MMRWIVLPMIVASMTTTTMAFVPFLSNNNNNNPQFCIPSKEKATPRKLTRSSSSISTKLTALTLDEDTTTKEEEESILPYLYDSSKTIPLLPAKTPLSSFYGNDETDDSSTSFSILSWNILLPNGSDNWWNHKMYASWVPMKAREWSHRHNLLKEQLLNSNADIICIQEADGDTFDDDFDFLLNNNNNNNGSGQYSHVLHKKFRFRCATFFKTDKFTLENEAHKDRVLVTTLKCKNNNNNNNSNDNDPDQLLHILNCHLSGGAAPERRLRQIHEGMDQLRKWNNAVFTKLQKQQKANRPNMKLLQQAKQDHRNHKMAAVMICGDFNSDGNTGVRKYIVNGRIEPEWYEPQYEDLTLTSKVKEHVYGTARLVDAAELAYGANVCDGDYGEGCPAPDCRPATYVVPNLASLLLEPMNNNGDIPRTQFGPQVAQGLADTLGLDDWCEREIDRAFETIDLDGSGTIEEEELQALLESVYRHIYGREEIERERDNFFKGFSKTTASSGSVDDGGGGLSKEQVFEKLLTLQQETTTNESNNNSDDPKEKQNGSSSMGIVQALGLSKFSKAELDRAFEDMDLDGNGIIDEYEVEKLLELVYDSSTTYGQYKKIIQDERAHFFGNFWGDNHNDDNRKNSAGLSKEQVTDRLLALQQELRGGSAGSELVEICTDADAERMIARFTPLLRDALDFTFDKFSSDGGVTMKEDEVEEFLILTNGELGRGGTWRHTQAMFSRKKEESKPAALTRQDFYNVFARELGEGKWWQVVYDLERCGATIRPVNKKGNPHHYQGWLDYMYFDSNRLVCKGFQEALTESELSRIYEDGDALPNEWHPSDHLPVAGVFSFQKN